MSCWRAVLSWNGQTLSIPENEEPIGLADSSFTLKRDEATAGVTAEIVIEKIQFVCSGASFVYAAVEADGPNAEVRVVIDYGCQGAMTTVFEGFLVLDAYEWDGTILTCAAIVDSPQTHVLARNEAQVNLFANVSVDGDATPEYDYLPITIDNASGRIQKSRAIAEKLSDFEITYNLADPADTLAPLQLCEDIPNGTGEYAWYKNVWINLGYETVRLDDFGTYFGQNSITGSLSGGNLYPPNEPPVILEATQTGSYRFYICNLCFRASVQAGPNASLATCNGTNYSSVLVFWLSDFCEARLTLNFQVNNDLPILWYDSGWVESPHVASGDFDGNRAWLGPTGTDVAGCIEIDQTHDLVIGDQVKLYWLVEARANYRRRLGIVGSGTSCQYTYLEVTEACCLYIEADIPDPLTETSGIRAVPIHEAFGRTLDATSENQITFYSEFFGRTDSSPNAYPSDGCGSRTAITNGYAIREFPLQGDPNPVPTCGVADADTTPQTGLFVTLKSLFENLSAVYCLGAAFFRLPDGRMSFRVEKREWFYQDAVALTLSDVSRRHSGSTEQFDATLLYNTFEGGYTTWRGEGVNGLDEQNGPRQWGLTNAKKTKNALQKRCEYVASGHLWEATRRQQYRNNQFEDWDFDADTFLICLEELNQSPTLSLIEDGVSGTPAQLLNPGQVYNWRISPNANARRWLAFLLPTLWPNETAADAVRFLGGDANFSAEGADNPLGLCDTPQRAENESLDADDARTAPFFVPRTVTFRYPLTRSQFDALQANPYGRIRVTWDDCPPAKDYFLLEVTWKPGGDSMLRLLEAR